MMGEGSNLACIDARCKASSRRSLMPIPTRVATDPRCDRPSAIGFPARLVASKVNGSAEDAVKRHAKAEILSYAAWR
jgi:hypothetical protein